MNNAVKTLIVTALVLVGLTVFMTARLQSALHQTVVLQQQNSQLQQEQFSLQQHFSEEKMKWQETFGRIQSELDSLQDVQKIKQLYAQSQDKLLTVEREFQQVKAEKISLEEANRRLDSRVNSLTGEFTKTLDNLKEAKQQLGQLSGDRLILTYEEKLKETRSQLEEKTRQIEQLQEQIRQTQAREKENAGQQLSWDRTLKRAQKEKETLQRKLTTLSAKYKRRLVPIGQLKQKIQTLESELNAQVEQRTKLEGDLTQERKKSAAVETRLAQLQQSLTSMQQQANTQLMESKDKIYRYEALKAENDMLRAQLTKAQELITAEQEKRLTLQKDLGAVQQELSGREEDKTRIHEHIATILAEKKKLEEQLKAQLDHADSLQGDLQMIQEKNQALDDIRLKNKQLQAEVSRLQEDVAAREKDVSRLEREKRELQDLKEVIAPDQQKIEDMENKLSQSYVMYDTAKSQLVKVTELLMRKELEAEKAQEKMAAYEKELAALKGGTAGVDQQKLQSLELLKDRVAVLNESLLEKDNKIKEHVEKINELRALSTTLEQKLAARDKDYEQAQHLYDTLRQQMLQTSELLSRRESDMVNTSQEVVSLRNDLSSLQTDLQQKKQELEDLKEKQRKTLDDLARATRMNITLQENLVELYEGKNRQGGAAAPPQRTPEQERAEQLRREVEQLLGH